MAQMFLIAFRNLIQHSRRTLLLGGAIAGVTALLVFLLCLSSGVHSTMLESATTLMTGHLNVGGFYKVTAGQSAPLITGFEKINQLVHETLPDIDYVAVRGRGWAKLVSHAASMQSAIGGINIENEPGFIKVIHPLSGRLEDLAQPNTIILFESQAKKLDVKVGDSVVISVLTARGVNNTVDVRVVAIAQEMGILSTFNVYVPEDSLRKLYQLNADSTGALHVHLKDMRRIPENIGKLRKVLEENGYLLMDQSSKPFWEKLNSTKREDWTGQKLDLTSWEDEMTFIRWAVTAVDGLMYILTVVLLIIIAIGIMNSMWIAIRERTREIGTLRAIGMQRWRVLAMFVIEAFTLGSLGTTVGAVLGLLIALALNAAQLPVPEGARMFLMAIHLKLSFEPVRVLGGMLVITGCTTLIAIIPSLYAARLKPISAMQHIG